MNYKKLSNTLQKLNYDFEVSLSEFKADKIFQKKGKLYLKEDKKELYDKWKKIKGIFTKLKGIIDTYSFSLLFKRNHNHFIIKYYCVICYYNMTLKLHETFQENEDFIRQFLDENYKENYSTIARYIYRANFLYYLNYPKEFLNLIQDKIDIELKWMLKKEIDYKIKLNFDYKNFYYYIKFKLDKIIHFLVKYSGLFLARIRFKASEKGLISDENIATFYTTSKPGDILLSRQNFVATNISIPGFWKHMSMYLGTGEYLQNNFKSEVFKNLEKQNHYIIESTGKGVKIAEFKEFSHRLDYLGVFRTTFSEKKIKNAIIETSKMLHKNYDYLFNYYSDNSFVCSELITKAYLKDSLDDEGLTIELVKIAGGLTYPPNDFAKKAYNESQKENKEIYGVLFIDSTIKNEQSFIASDNELLKSYKRSRFSFLLK